MGMFPEDLKRARKSGGSLGLARAHSMASSEGKSEEKWRVALMASSLAGLLVSSSGYRPVISMAQPLAG